RRPFRLAAGVALEGAREREFAQLVAHHVLRDEDWEVRPPIVDGDRVPDHLREDGRPARPCLQNALLAARVHIVDPLQQLLVRVRPLLDRSTHAVVLNAPHPPAASPLVERRRRASDGGEVPPPYFRFLTMYLSVRLLW